MCLQSIGDRTGARISLGSFSTPIYPACSAFVYGATCGPKKIPYNPFLSPKRRVMPRKQSDTVQLKLRFPERVRNRIEAAAERNQRSMNAEIVARLEQSFERDDRAALIEATAHATANAIVQGL